jgi:hypothetical protein
MKETWAQLSSDAVETVERASQEAEREHAVVLAVADKAGSGLADLRSKLTLACGTVNKRASELATAEEAFRDAAHAVGEGDRRSASKELERVELAKRALVEAEAVQAALESRVTDASETASRAAESLQDAKRVMHDCALDLRRCHVGAEMLKLSAALAPVEQALIEFFNAAEAARQFGCTPEAPETFRRRLLEVLDEVLGSVLWLPATKSAPVVEPTVRARVRVGTSYGGVSAGEYVEVTERELRRCEHALVAPEREAAEREADEREADEREAEREPRLEQERTWHRLYKETKDRLNAAFFENQARSKAAIDRRADEIRKEET